MSTLGYLKAARERYQRGLREQAEDRRRTQALEDKQMALLDAEIAALQQDQPGTGNAAVAQQAQQQASEYLSKWNQTLQKAEGVYSSAISDVDKAGNLIDRAYTDLGELDAVGQDIKGEWENFQQEFGGMKGELLEGGREAMGMRSDLRRQFMDLATADEEGAAGRAMADVAGAAERGRQAEAMRLSSLGIDPTSGRARSFMRMSRDQEALSGAMAAGKARREEKDRVTGLTAQGLQLIDPSKDISAATQIQQMSGDLLAQRSQMATTKAGLQTQLAGARGDLASTRTRVGSGMARDIGQQYGEYGAAQQGIAYGATGTPGTPGAPGATTSTPITRTAARRKIDLTTPKMQAFQAAANKTAKMREQYYG